MIVQERAGLFLLEADDPVGDLESELGKAWIGLDPPPGAAGNWQRFTCFVWDRARDLPEVRTGTKPVPVKAKCPRELYLVDRCQSDLRCRGERQQYLTREVILIGVRGGGFIRMGVDAAMGIDARPKRRRKPRDPAPAELAVGTLAQREDEQGAFGDRTIIVGASEP